MILEYILRGGGLYTINVSEARIFGKHFPGNQGKLWELM